MIHANDIVGLSSSVNQPIIIDHDMHNSLDERVKEFLHIAAQRKYKVLRDVLPVEVFLKFIDDNVIAYTEDSRFHDLGLNYKIDKIPQNGLLDENNWKILRKAFFHRLTTTVEEAASLTHNQVAFYVKTWIEMNSGIKFSDLPKVVNHDYWPRMLWNNNAHQWWLQNKSEILGPNANKQRKRKKMSNIHGALSPNLPPTINGWLDPGLSVISDDNWVVVRTRLVEANANLLRLSGNNFQKVIVEGEYQPTFNAPETRPPTKFPMLDINKTTEYHYSSIPSVYSQPIKFEFDYPPNVNIDHPPIIVCSPYLAFAFQKNNISTQHIPSLESSALENPEHTNSYLYHAKMGNFSFPSIATDASNFSVGLHASIEKEK